MVWNFKFLPHKKFFSLRLLSSEFGSEIRQAKQYSCFSHCSLGRPCPTSGGKCLVRKGVVGILCQTSCCLSPKMVLFLSSETCILKESNKNIHVHHVHTKLRPVIRMHNSAQNPFQKEKFSIRPFTMPLPPNPIKNHTPPASFRYILISADCVSHSLVGPA